MIKVYTDKNVSELSSKYIFGPTQFYNTYVVENGYIVGKEKINEQGYYPIIDECSFRNEVRSIGNKLYNHLIKNNIELSFSIFGSIIADTDIKKVDNDIFKIISPFIDKYGLPLNYIDIQNNDIKGTNNISVITSLFVLAYLTPLLFGNNNTKTIREYCKNLNIDITNRKETIIEFYNNQFDALLHPMDFKFRFINDMPFFISHNLFSFVFKRIMFDIHDKSLDYKITSTCKNCGNVIEKDTNYFGDSKTIHVRRYCDDCEQLFLPKTQKAKDIDRLDKKIKLYNSIKENREILHQLDINDNYKNLYLEASKVTNYNKIGLTDRAKLNHTKMNDDIIKAINNLKN